MKVKLITCMVLMREVCLLAYQSKHRISVDTVSQNLHNTPELLHLIPTHDEFVIGCSKHAPDVNRDKVFNNTR